MPDETSPLPLASSPPPAPAAPPLAAGTASPVVAAAPAPSAASSVHLFGGFKGGRPRKDGLRSGSPEALEADRVKDAERKRRAREREVAALPSAGPSSSPVATPAGPPPPADLPPCDAPGLGVQLWTPEDTLPLASETLDLIESLETESLKNKCVKARLPEGFQREFEKELPWEKAPKKSVAKGASVLLAKGLSKAGVSKDTGGLLQMIPGLALLVAQRRGLHKRLDELIKLANQPTEKKP